MSKCGLINTFFNLSDRKQYVVVDGASSETTPVISGLPQGSVLGPLPFLVYITCVSLPPLTSGSRLTMYADDILLFKPIMNCPGDYGSLQKDIDAIFECTNTCHLTLNAAECKYIIASRKRQPHLGLFLGSCTMEQARAQLPLLRCFSDIYPYLERPHSATMYQSQETCWYAI